MYNFKGPLFCDAAKRAAFSAKKIIDDATAQSDGAHLLELWQMRQPFYPTGDTDLLNRFIVDAIKAGASEGMQHFDGEIEKLVRAGTVDVDTGLAYATNPGNLRLALADLGGVPAEA